MYAEVPAGSFHADPFHGSGLLLWSIRISSRAAARINRRARSIRCASVWPLTRASIVPAPSMRFPIRD